MTRMGFKKNDVKELIAECKRRGGTVKKVKSVPKSNSAYWRDKADALFSDIVRSVGHCEICLKQGHPRKDGMPVVGLDVHHLIERGQYGYRYDLCNGISLCTSCHGARVEFRNKYANAHGSDEQKERFFERLKSRNLAQWNWYQKHKDEKRRTSNLSFEQEYLVLVKVRENWNKK